MQRLSREFPLGAGGTMQRLGLRLGALTAVGLLSACNGGPQFQQLPTNLMEGFSAPGVMARARSAQPSGAFATAAYQDLMKHAEYEFVQTDYRDAMFHARKAIAVASGQTIAPQNPSERMLPADKVAEIQDGYGRLNTVLGNGGMDRNPEAAGVAIGSFDCWIEQQEENFQPADIASCRDAFFTAMGQLEQKAQPQVGELTQLSTDVLFDFAKAVIRPDAEPKLDQVAEMVVADTTADILVWGFTDTAGPADYNQKLSERRANAVADYLEKKGVERSRMSIEGFGETKLAVQTPDNTPNAQNRRVEIRRR
jgi:OOP family OmpA-OmpF porin